MQPFHSDRLCYRPFREVDADAVFAFFGDPEVMRFSAFGVHPDIERTRAFLAHHIDHDRRRGFGLWAVVERETDDLIGIAGLTEFDPGDADSDLELAYRLRRDRWGKGYASEAAHVWVAKGFADLGVPRIVAVVASDHVVSKRVLEKVGMRFVEARTKNGNRVDYMVVRRGDPAGELSD
jgi:RimJ/RimL family protein N-acetyltransferase